MIAAYHHRRPTHRPAAHAGGYVRGVDWDKQYAVDSLVQAKVLGDAYGGGISNGLTLRNSETVARLRYVDQQVVEV